ncbi:hypothetical protein AYI68_g3365 [Smittium mucronatum]|uniref:Uncharacterized protein n=1 Tax=Smittium mucronatum TaxID=133383 RepID=A0A1R0H039_9FUNG|nr:hypothetical protein AYI68_g3365 [Smittium mucronatum]
MGMIMRDHELVEFGYYPYGFPLKVDAWPEVAEHKDSDTSISFSSEISAIGEDLDPSVNLVFQYQHHDRVLTYYSYRGDCPNTKFLSLQ